MGLVEVFVLRGKNVGEHVVAGGELRIEANGGAEALFDGIGVGFAEMLKRELGEIEVCEVIVGAKVDGFAEPPGGGGAIVFAEGKKAEGLARLRVLWVRSED
jgi:hypothetical protein